ncbi:MAG: amidase family protein, partial [Candidatus Hydrogenedentota bacterium]
KVYEDYAKSLGHPVPIDLPEIVARAGKAVHKQYQAAQAERWLAREAWESFFKDFDVFLMPTDFVNAFPHDQSFQMARTLKTSLGVRPYFDLLSWISFATMTGNPATVAPVGLTSEGLPTGMQILGPYLEDATTIDFAAKMAEVVGGFTPPPKYGA